MIGLMMMTFLLFFAFVINTGMLVNAKINLQNAADLAAYAGAAEQARLLNSISFLNYEMRRQYKKFLFRYYVFGNLAQKQFPRGGGDETPMLWSPDGTLMYNVPVVCIVSNQNDNYCQMSKLTKITIPPQTLLDNINETLRGQLTEIERIRQDHCGSISRTNTNLLIRWLYNTDPTLEVLPQNIASDEQKRIFALTKGISYGLGLIPQELLLRLRIKTLEDYINARQEESVTLERAENLKNSVDPASKERTINAFFSAYQTLGEHTFIDDSIVMDEILPNAGDQANLIRLSDIQAKFDTYSIELELGPGQAQSNAKDCNPLLTPVPVKTPVVLGVFKDRKVLTYYAIRLKAKARILFSPWGTMELKAYSAAQPFGSRIGPEHNESAFLRTAAPPNIPPNVAAKIVGKVPNLAIFQNDSAGTGKGWDKKNVMSALYQKFMAPGAPIQSQLTQAETDRAMHAAMAPNPWEGNRYNIMSDMGNDPMFRYFDINQQAALWAPIFPPNKISTARNEIRNLLDKLFATDVVGSQTGTTADEVEKLKQALDIGMSKYLTKLLNGQGQGGEGFKVAKMDDPFTTDLRDPATQPPQLINIAHDIMMRDPKSFKTSWNEVTRGDFREQGRIGYSVKFISFERLVSNMLPSDGIEPPTNKPNPDAEAEGDIPHIKH